MTHDLMMLTETFYRDKPRMVQFRDPTRSMTPFTIPQSIERFINDRETTFITQMTYNIREWRLQRHRSEFHQWLIHFNTVHWTAQSVLTLQFSTGPSKLLNLIELEIVSGTTFTCLGDWKWPILLTPVVMTKLIPVGRMTVTLRSHLGFVGHPKFGISHIWFLLKLCIMKR